MLAFQPSNNKMIIDNNIHPNNQNYSKFCIFSQKLKNIFLMMHEYFTLTHYCVIKFKCT